MKEQKLRFSGNMNSAPHDCTWQPWLLDIIVLEDQNVRMGNRMPHQKNKNTPHI